MNQAENILKKTGIIPVIKLDDARCAVPLAKALLAGGIGAAEITFRTPAAASSIQAIAEQVPDMFVCAGTVLNTEQAKLAVSSGAAAVIAPGTNPAVVTWCLERGIPVYPGCATPTEIEAALRMGLTTLKLFPAEVVGGVKLLKALFGPYRDVKFMPTGGISPTNAGEYLRQPNVIACGGSWLCPEQAVLQEDWAAVETAAREAADLVRAARNAAC